MYRIAIQVKELISSNVTHVVERASNPAKMLHQLQRECEEAIISLEGERTKARRQKDRLETNLAQCELREADWSDKAQAAVDNGREDLARAALVARDECRKSMEQLRKDIVDTEEDLAEIKSAIKELEEKRSETRDRLRDQRAADGERSGTTGSSPSRVDRRMERISELERRTEFATDDTASCRGNASVDREIEEMQRDRNIDEELAAMRAKSSRPAKGKSSGSKRKPKAA